MSRTCAHVPSRGRGDFAGGIKLRPLDSPGTSVSSQGPYKREAGGSEAERDGRCCAAGCEDGGGAASQGCGTSRSWKSGNKGKKSVCKGYTLYDPNLMTFWKRQDHGAGERITGCRGWSGEGQDEQVGHREVFRAGTLFCRTRSCWTQDDIRLAKPTECTPRVTLRVTLGLGGVQCRCRPRPMAGGELALLGGRPGPGDACGLQHPKRPIGDFPGGPVGKTLRSQCRAPGFDPSSGL